MRSPEQKDLRRIVRGVLSAYFAWRKAADDVDAEIAFSQLRRRAYDILTWLADEESKPKKKKDTNQKTTGDKA